MMMKLKEEMKEYYFVVVLFKRKAEGLGTKG